MVFNVFRSLEKISEQLMKRLMGCAETAIRTGYIASVSESLENRFAIVDVINANLARCINFRGTK